MNSLKPAPDRRPSFKACAAAISLVLAISALGRGVTATGNVGAKRRCTLDRVEFTGYGIDAPRAANHSDYAGKNVTGAAVVWLGTMGPKGLDATYQRVLNGRNGYATQQQHAAASIGPENRS